MKRRYAPVRTCTAVAALVIVLATGACAMDSDDPITGPADGSVRLRGTLSGLVRGATAPVSGGRALSSAVVNVGALPVVAGELQADPGTPVPETAVEEDGSFELDVPPAAETDHVLLVTNPDGGVGVEQSLGFIELPVGGEASTGWDLTETDETVIDLGALSGSADSFLADNSSQDLLDVLNADQIALLLQAQRDNYLKITMNEYLNPDEPFELQFDHWISLDGASTIGTWVEPGTLYDPGAYGYNYIIEFNPEDIDDPELTMQQVQDQGISLELIPPEIISLQDGTQVGPDTPILPDDFGIDGTNPDLSAVSFTDAPPDGLWTLNFRGEKTAVYAFGITTPFDEDGFILYFLPVVNMTVDGSDRLTNVELRWYYYDPATGTYERLDEATTELPIFGDWDLELDLNLQNNPAGLEEPEYMLDTVANEPIPVPDELYLGSSQTNYPEVTGIRVDYNAGGLFVFYRFAF